MPLQGVGVKGTWRTGTEDLVAGGSAEAQLKKQKLDGCARTGRVTHVWQIRKVISFSKGLSMGWTFQEM